MNSKIKEIMNLHKLCGIYTNVEATNKFAVGYILRADEKYFIMECIDQYGYSDGYWCKLIENIVEIELDSEYLSSILKLIALNKQEKYPELDFNEDLLVNLIKYAMENDKICTFQICNSGYDDAVGLIKRLNTDYVEVNAVDRFGKFDGIQILSLKSISHMSCDSCDEIKISKLLSNS